MVKHSQVWKYFSQSSENSVNCALCNQRLSFTHKSTTSMKYHMERKHPLQWALGTNVREIDSDPLTGDSVSTVVISQDADPEYDPEQLQSPKAKSRRLKSQKNQSETALVPYNVDKQLTQVGGSSNRIFNNTTQLDGAKIAAITYFITEMLVRDLLPLKQVENQGFKQLIDYMEPTYSIPSREGITQSLNRLYNEVKPIVVQCLRQADTLSLTMDIWTSATSRLYVTLSAHWVNKDWSLTKRVLSTSSLEAGYAVEDLGSRVLQTLNDYSINLEKVTAIVHSDSENHPTEIGGIPAVTCFAFTLQEAVKKALELPSVLRLVTAARKLVGSVAHLSGSIVEWPSQDGEKTQLNVSEIKLESDVPSRWFTTCTMLKLLHEQRTILGVLVGDDAMDRSSEGVLGPNSDQWDVLGEIVSVLRPLKTATDVISGEKNVSVSGVFPILHGLTTVHLMEDLEDSATAQLFKEVIRSEINSRWFLDSLDVVETVPVIASLLDPRYRDPLYLSVEQRGNVKDTLLKVIASCPAKDQNGTNTEERQSILPTSSKQSYLSDLEFLLGRHVNRDRQSKSISTSNASEAEYKLYMDPVMNPPAATDTNSLLWWQANRLRFPNLANNAKRYLCVPATSSPTDRLFTTEGIHFECSRSQLEPECVNHLLFLNSNISDRQK